MAILIDLILIAMFLLSIFLGYKKGLIGVAFKIVSFFIAIVITLILYRPVAGAIIKNTTIDETIENIIVERLSSTKIEEGEKINKAETNLPNMIVDYINEGVENTVNSVKDNIVQTVAKDLAENAIYILTMVGLFVILRIVLLFAKALLEAVSELPIVKQFNEVGGILYGILRALVCIYILLTIISFFSPMLEQTSILTIIEQTILTKWLYNHNIILNLFFS